MSKSLISASRAATDIPGPASGGRMMTQDTAMNSQNSRSIQELFSDAVGQLAKLVGNEFELARAELSEKASQAGRAATIIGAGAVILTPALVLLLFALSAALIRSGFSETLANCMAFFKYDWVASVSLSPSTE